ncbi:hypothetical protein RRG08_038579 [Elysia crispata]|uniref:Uncharacterized protein n=1 Tax=Elysia crispata TaxID=231223 RepID=A0AAE0YG38_9GAST|nr:hypothetical protein RRG08_038579 [Elysia crispata]
MFVGRFQPPLVIILRSRILSRDVLGGDLYVKTQVLAIMSQIVLCIYFTSQRQVCVIVSSGSGYSRNRPLVGDSVDGHLVLDRQDVIRRFCLIKVRRHGSSIQMSISSGETG